MGAARVVGSGGRSVGVRIGEGAPRRGWGGWVLAGVRWEVVRCGLGCGLVRGFVLGCFADRSTNVGG